MTERSAGGFRPVRPWLRPVLLAAGWVCVVVGVTALVLPVVPTTPFLLVAAACFARSSKRFYDWLLAHRWFGPPIRNYREKGGMTRRQKTVALAVFWPAIVGSLIVAGWVWARAFLAASAVGVTWYILRLKTVREDEG